MEQVFLGISMEDDGSGKKKDREADAPSCGGAAGGDGGSLDLCFGFGYNTTSHHDVDEVISCHRDKFGRTDAFPFRTSSTAAAASPIFTAAASASTPLPPLHPSVGCSLPFGNGAVSMYGPNMFRAAERAAAHQDAAARSLQMQLQASLAASPFKSASHLAAAASSAPPVSAAGTSCATALLPHHPLFTPAQWQELQRQALIYKHFVSSAPVPPDLLIDTRCIHPNASVAPGGGFLNLRLSGGAADPEPGRCRRTDGKKWRCSRDAAPDQRYCERHLHRGRPRSRKPVERTRNKAAAAADGKDNINNGDPAAASDLGGVTPTAFPPGLPTKSSTALQIASPPPPTYCGPALPKPDLMKLPFLSMLPEKEEPRYLDWMMKDGGISEISHHAAPDTSSTVDIACFRSTPVLPVLQGYPDFRHLNPGMSDLNAPSYYPFVHTEQPAPPRRFIDAWSAEGHTVGGAASSSSHDMPNNQSFGAASSEQLSPSSLTLSMSGGSGRGGDYAAEHVQMGLSVNELSSNNKSQAMFGPFGGPLAEVLQSGSSVASPRTSGGGNDCCVLVGPPGTTSYTGLMNLMSRSCCSGSEGGVISPRGESPQGVLSSPTGVLQRGLVSLSDSSSNSSPRFETGCGGARPEVVGLQWMNQNKKWW